MYCIRIARTVYERVKCLRHALRRGQALRPKLYSTVDPVPLML